MGSAPSCKQYLTRPSDNLRYSVDTEATVLANLESVIKSCVGVIKWKSYSWSDLAELIASNQDTYIASLQAEISERLDEVEIYDIRLIPLMGVIYPPGIGPRTGAWSYLPDMSSREWKYLDHKGNRFGGVTKVNVADHAAMGPIPPLPSYDAFAIQAAYSDLLREAEASEDSYLIKVKHQYCVTQYDPPHGGFKWELELVLLKICVRATRCMILQIAATDPGVDGLSQVAATTMGGVELASVSFSLQDNTAELLTLLANQCNVEERTLRLVFPSGKIGDSRSRCNKVADMLTIQSEEGKTSPDVNNGGNDFFPDVASTANVASSPDGSGGSCSVS